jgi:hypothetical protein
MVVAVVALAFGLSFGTVFALDPLNKEDAAKDYDVDGLSNLMEFVYGTDPYNADTDGDGCPDGWVVYYDINRASFPDGGRKARFDSDGDGVPDVNVDPDYKFDPANGLTASDRPDDDGWDNLQEYREGTDPTNPDTDSDGRYDDVDPQPLIPNPPDHTHTNPSGQAQGMGMAADLAGAWC